MHFAIFRRCGGALLCAALVAALLVSPASAAGDTLTLSGEISGEYRVPEGVAKVVLDGVRAADFESGVVLTASAEVELADGSENVCGIMAQGDLRVTGGGALLGGPGIYAFGTLTLDLNGVVVLYGGSIGSFSNDIIINSGTFRLQSRENGGGIIHASNGDVILNGGDISMWSDSVAVSTIDGDIVVKEAIIDISAAETAMLADHIILPETVQGSIEIITSESGAASGQAIAASGEPAKRIQISKELNAAELQIGAPVIIDGKADVGASVVLGERANDAEEIVPAAAECASIDPFAWIAAGVAAVLGIATMIVFGKKKT